MTADRMPERHVKRADDGQGFETWTRFQGDRVKVRRVNGQWRMEGSWLGSIYVESTSKPAVSTKVGDDIDARLRAQGICPRCACSDTPGGHAAGCIDGRGWYR